MKNIFSFEMFKAINELKVYGEADDNKYFILVRENLWIFDEDEYEDLFPEISKKIEGLEGDMHDDLQFIVEQRPYILVGSLDDNTAFINTHQFRQGGQSADVRKLKKFLGNGYTVKVGFSVMDKDEEIDIDEETDYFHGTTYGHLQNILKKGILPNPEKTNFKNIEHTDTVFFTTSLEKAAFHAEHAARKNNSFPVIIEFRIPDRDKIVSDYDIVINFFGSESEEALSSNYNHIYNTANISNIPDEADQYYADMYKGRSLTTKLGVYGYKGRIPASFIDCVVMDEDMF